ncbi:MAG TPA: radical SAM protein [Polyangiales bacterium]|nr:radical SAM protein [Polyangiales bacterium]
MSANGEHVETPPRPMGNARAMLARLAEKWKSPLSAGIEVSDRCNEVCVHCYQEQGRKGEMTTAQLFGLMDELASMGVLLLTISGGEATLRKDFLELVGYARHKGFAVRIFTNGLTMSRELAAALAGLAVQNVEISLYSTRSETHDFMTGVPGSFEKTVAGVRNLVEFGVSVTVKTPVMTINESELDEYAAFAASLGAAHALDLGELVPREGGSRAPELFQIKTETRAAILRALSKSDVTPARPLTQAPCSAAESIIIEPNGELRPCTSLEFDLGHALEDGIAAAYHSNERALAIRQLTWLNLHGCRECALRVYCSHCYANALAQTGDALGPYPGACESAVSVYEARTGRTLELARQAGPFREIGEGVFENIPDVVTSEDDALAARLGWTRRVGGPIADPKLRALPGDLVQIRRPGRKKSQLVRIPTTASNVPAESPAAFGRELNSTVEVARENT